VTDDAPERPDREPESSSTGDIIDAGGTSNTRELEPAAPIHDGDVGVERLGAEHARLHRRDDEELLRHSPDEDR
jgi:hypothetical protein